MKNYVVLLAGGIGSRMKADIPKQFLLIDGKPIIVYSIENFQKNQNIEKIVIVCVKEWIPHLQKIVFDYKLSKVAWIIEGGNSGHDSIRNGIFFLKDKIDKDDFVIVHDAVRPILPQMIIDDLLSVAHKNGNASSSIICHAPIVYTEDFISGNKDVDRDHVMLTQAPQAFKYSLALDCYERAEKDNMHNFTYTSSLIIHYGFSVFFAKGTTSNIKITKKEDLALFSTLIKLQEDSIVE